MNFFNYSLADIGVLAVVALTVCGFGCHQHANTSAAATKSDFNGAPAKTAEEMAEIDIHVARAKLAEDDRKLVDAQEWCVVSKESRLGSMGLPIKLMVKDQPVFICCKSCEKKALDNPDSTLTKLEELKAKKIAQMAAK